MYEEKKKKRVTARSTGFKGNDASGGEWERNECEIIMDKEGKAIAS